jgi:hypothetical protein
MKTAASKMHQALALFDLEKRTLFYDRRHETKVMVAWNKHLVFVCARGSFAAANWAADAKVWLSCIAPCE